MEPSSLAFNKFCTDFSAFLLVSIILHISPEKEVSGRRVPQAENQEFQCNENIDSRAHQNGTIASPLHPDAYPADITCRYIFTGVGRERIQLRFLHIDLHFPSGDPAAPIDCAGSDSVSVYIFINGQTEELDTWCGRKLPPMLMSNQHKMVVEFRSYHSSPAVTGFKAQYSFVTNFGIHEGKQDNRGTCVFNYQSSVKSHGEITSPNYNGLYPRNTECHYLFYGKEKERVQITFVDFDVDGLNPRCEENTKSDYVSFSNFADTEDRKMTRLCGHPPKEKREIWSDGPFFRVIFRSNDIYDSTGFHAYYQFRGVDTNQEASRNSHVPNDRGADTFKYQGQKKNSGNSDYILSDWKTRGGYFPLAPLNSLTIICVTVMLYLLPPRIF